MKFMKVVLSSILFCSIVSLADFQPLKSPAFLGAMHAHLLKKAATEGGFGSETKIKVAEQFCDLEDLETGDLIFSPKTNDSQEIVLKRRLCLPYYFEIEVGDLTISAASAQLFYDEVTGDWIEAQNLTQEHIVGGEFVDKATKINSYHIFYKLNVEDELFIIERDDFLVHNEALFIATAAGVHIGRLMLLYPITQAIGRTISVKKIWDRLYNLWELKETAEPDSVHYHYVKKLTEKVRSYYTVRRAALLDLLQKYQQMQQVVEAIINQFSPGLGLFNHLQKHPQASQLLPSFEVESRYSYNDQQKLLQLRDQELAGIEKEIVQIQWGLGVYFDEIMNHQDSLGSELRSRINVLGQIKQMFSVKAQECRHNRNAIHDVQALLQQQYQQIILIDVLLHYFIAKSEGWSVIAQIYFGGAQTALFRESSNVLNCCDGNYYQEMVSLPQDLKSKVPLMRSQFQACEKMMAQFGMSINGRAVQSFVQQAQAEMKKSEENHRQNIMVKKSASICFPMPPDDPDPDDEEEKEELTYENHPHDDASNHFPDECECLNSDCKHSKQVPHGLREEHNLPDTIKNRKRIHDLIRDKNNRVAFDKDGNMWYEQMQPDGQLWGQVRVENGQVQNCGLNINNYRVPDPVLGLNRAKPTQWKK